MLIDKKLKYSYNDVCVIPAYVTTIEHRSECNPFLDNGKLPIFTAPMSTVVGLDNFDLFEQNYINAILPRSVELSKRIEYAKDGKWTAFSLNEFIDLFTDNDKSKEFINNNVKHILIDVANGHMMKIYQNTKKAKNIFGDNIEIMVGNIANPLSYKLSCEYGVSYVRVSIGSGQGCITSSNTAIHYPNASLISETAQIKNKISQTQNIPIDKLPKIIADGGIRNYSDVIKALALGADYVMIGGLFSTLIESSGDVFYFDENNKKTFIHDKYSIKEQDGTFYNNTEIINHDLYKEFYGMASKKGQIDINGKKTKTSEGVIKTLKVLTNVDKWVNNMISYLQSAMSYTNITNIKDINNAEVVLISNNTYNSVNK